MAFADDRALDVRYVELYTAYYGSVRRFAFASLKTNNEELVADITADAWLKVYRGLRTYQERDTPIINWIFQIVRNVIYDWRRLKQAVPLNPEVHDRADPFVDLDFATVISDDSLEGWFAQLNERDREILRLRYVEGLDLASIGVAIGSTEATTKKLHQRALARMRRVIEGNPARKTGRPATLRRPA